MYLFFTVSFIPVKFFPICIQNHRILPAKDIYAVIVVRFCRAEIEHEHISQKTTAEVCSKGKRSAIKRVKEVASASFLCVGQKGSLRGFLKMVWKTGMNFLANLMIQLAETYRHLSASRTWCSHDNERT